MQKKNNGNSSSRGVCQRLFNFFTENLRRVTLGQQESFGPFANQKRELMLVHYQDHEGANYDSGLGSESQIHIKPSEGVESWNLVDKFADRGQMHKDDGIPDQVPPSREKATEKGKKKVSEESPWRKKELPLFLEKTVHPLSKSSSNLTIAAPSKGAKMMVSIKESGEEKRKKEKGKSIPNGNLTLPRQYEEEKSTTRRVIGSPSINERSESYINRRKEAMSKNL